jgi:hemerythrin-like domain-containing protein
MRSTLLAGPAPDYTDPLGLLSACHRRMLGFCDLLARTQAHLATRGVDEEAVDAARRVMHYFDTAATLHHLDEERDLFPLLTDQPTLVPLMERLQTEHRELESRWQTLASQLRHILEGAIETRASEDAVTLFCGTYREHIDREETLLLPAARACLRSHEVQRLGRAMAARRGLDAQ